MACAFSWALQQGLFWALSAAPSVTDLAQVLDAPTDDGVAGDYVALGEEVVRVRGAGDAVTATHDVMVSVFSAAHGFARSKAIAEAVVAALEQTPPAVAGARVVGLRYLRSRARRGRNSARRRVDLTFRIILESL